MATTVVFTWTACWVCFFFLISWCKPCTELNCNCNYSDDDFFFPWRKRGISLRSRLEIFKYFKGFPLPNTGVFIKTGGKAEVCVVFPTLALRKSLPLTSVELCSVLVRLDLLSISNRASLLGQRETWDTNTVTKFFITTLKKQPLSVLHTKNLAILPTKFIFGRNSFVQILHNMLCVSFPKWNYISYMCFH